MSTFAWVDHSEKQRRQILDAIDLFREKDTRDELGIAGIRDTFSNMLFPGTGSLQTRARYFFFVPWMYQEFEADRASAADIARRGRKFEIQLIDVLADSIDRDGTIGIVARSSLQRLPSSIYWNGLKVLGICQFLGSQAEYQRSFDRRNAGVASVRRNDDGEFVGAVSAAWHKGLPAASKFPANADFGLTSAEARYLKGRVLENHGSSFFAFLLDREYTDVETQFAWEHPASTVVPQELRRELDHARCFSELMHGASVLYNLYLAELEPRRSEIVDACEVMFEGWQQLISDHKAELQKWDRRDFWNLLIARFYKPSISTKSFVDEWCNRVLSSDLNGLRSDDATRRLIFDREAQIKGTLARCTNTRSREMWRGEAGLGRLDFRWFNARILVRDIAAGLTNGHA